MNKELKTAIDLQISKDVLNAKKLYKHLIKILEKEDLEIAYINLGNIYFEENKTQEALELYNKALIVNPYNEKTYFNIAMIHLEDKDFEESRSFFLKAIALKKDYVNALINLAIVSKRLDYFDESVVYFKQAIVYDKKNPDIYYNYANTLIKQEKHLEALFFLDKALEFSFSDKSKILYTKALIYQNKNLYLEAFELLQKAIIYKKDYPNASFAIGTIQLLYGDFKNGWKNYEYRWDASNDLERPNYDVKWYNGEDLTNKRILVQQEQGYGDNIQFIRYISKLTQKNTVVYLAIKEELHKIFSFIPNITIVSDNTTVEKIDYFTSLLDLPRIFYNNQDEFLYKDKYLDFIPDNKFKLKNNRKLNIGFSYRGSPLHKGDKKRNIPLDEFEVLFKNQKVDFYSLQFENNEELIAYQKKYSNIYDCKKYIKDFNDTANIVNKLDFVITIDSSIVHLCGALGVKTILVLGENTEWRWLLNTNKSIWYNSISLYRKYTYKSFERLFDKLNNDLLKK